jgi:hypothetical protein
MVMKGKPTKMKSSSCFHNLKKESTMEKNKSSILRLLFCCIIVLAAGCSSTKLVDIRSNISYQSPPLNKMLVISVSRNSTYRHIWEDAFSAGLAKHKVAAIPSYRLFPDAVPDTSQVIQIVRSNGFDGILVYRRLPSEMKSHYRQGFGMSDDNMVYDRFTERFVVSYYRDVEYAAYTDSQKIDIRAIDVWATQKEGQMIWSATGRTPEPNSMQDVRPEIVNLVVSDLTNRNIIAPEQ